jgi:hypothetical protein
LPAKHSVHINRSDKPVQKTKFVSNINRMVLVLKKGATKDEVAALEKSFTDKKRRAALMQKNTMVCSNSKKPRCKSKKA